MLARILLGGILQIGQILVPEQGVVIQVQLRIQRQQFAGRGDDQWIDFEQTGVAFLHQPEGGGQQGGKSADLFAFQAQSEREVAALVRLQPCRRTDYFGQDGVRIPNRHLLDIHATGRRGHDHEAFPAAIDQHAEVELPFQGNGFLDQNGIDRQSGRPGLSGYQARTQHGIDRRFKFIPAGHPLHAAGLAASACMHLRLDDPGIALQGGGNRACIGR